MCRFPRKLAALPARGRENSPRRRRYASAASARFALARRDRDTENRRGANARFASPSNARTRHAATLFRSVDDNRPGAGEEHERRPAVTTRARESGGDGVAWHGKPARCERAIRFTVAFAFGNGRVGARMRERAAPPLLSASGGEMRTGAGEEPERRRAVTTRARESQDNRIRIWQVSVVIRQSVWWLVVRGREGGSEQEPACWNLSRHS
jgi:hypothetical protein